MEFTEYLLKVSGCLMVFAAIYQILLKNLTFFKWNRFFLLGSLCLSLVIPAVKIELRKEIFVESPAMADELVQILETNEAPERDYTERDGFLGWETFLFAAYVFISTTLFLKLTVHLLRIFWNARSSGKVNNRLIICPPLKNLKNCSFFNIVFIDRSDHLEYQYTEILNHENEHIRRLHSIDKLIAEMVICILWFNPLVYYFRRMINLNHEFEVDEAMTSHLKKAEYAGLLLHVSESQSLLFTNSFSMNSLETRINMLFTHKSKKMKKLLYLSFVPAVLGLGIYLSVQVVYANMYLPEKSQLNLMESSPATQNSVSAESSKEPVPIEQLKSGNLITVNSSEKNATQKDLLAAQWKNVIRRNESPSVTAPAIKLKDKIKVILDPGHGGKDNSSKVNGIFEKDLTLEIAKKVQKVLEDQGYEVVLTRDNDKFLSLSERTQFKGDVFISLHASSYSKDKQGSKKGMEIFIGSAMEKDPSLLDQSLELAQTFQSELSKIDETTVSQSIKKMGLFVLRNNTVPAITIELGYMTDPSDLKFMSQKSGQQEIGMAFARALERFKAGS